MSKATIYFETTLQAALYKHELVGQISDGMWENSTPRDHWIRPCEADIAVDESNPRVESVHLFKRNYNFANTQLVDVVGDRMKNIVMLAKAGYDDSVISDFDDVDSYSHVMFAENSPNEYWAKKAAKFEAVFGTKEVYDKVVMTDRISTAALKKQLRRMSEIVNSNSMRTKFK